MTITTRGSRTEQTIVKTEAGNVSMPLSVFPDPALLTKNLTLAIETAVCDWTNGKPAVKPGTLPSIATKFNTYCGYVEQYLIEKEAEMKANPSAYTAEEVSTMGDIVTASHEAGEEKNIKKQVARVVIPTVAIVIVLVIVYLIFKYSPEMMKGVMAMKSPAIPPGGTKP